MSKRFNYIDVVLIMLILIWQVLILTTFKPTAFWDTGSYVDEAKSLMQHGTFTYENYRTVGYIYFLIAIYAIFGIGNQLAVAIVQALINTITIWLSYRLAIWVIGNRKWALVVPIMLLLDPLFMLQEIVILPDSPVILPFLLVIMLAYKIYLNAYEKGKLSIWYSLLIGFLIGLATLFKPVFQLYFVIPALGILLVSTSNVSKGRKLAGVLAIILGFLVLVGPQVIFNKYKYGVAKIALHTGGNLLNRVSRIDLLRDLPDKFSREKAIYERLHKRWEYYNKVSKKIASKLESDGCGGGYYMHWCYRLPFKSPIKRYEYMYEMAWNIIIHHPIDYVWEVMRGIWVMLTYQDRTVLIATDPHFSSNRHIYNSANLISIIWHTLGTLLYVLYPVIAIIALVGGGYLYFVEKEKLRKLLLMLVFWSMVYIVVVVAASEGFHRDFNRFRLPAIPLIYVLFIASVKEGIRLVRKAK